jgi:RNA polymerase sigma-70 factor (ECF subfamily)
VIHDRADGAPTLNETTLKALIPKLRGFLSRRISNDADVDDLTQEVLLRVHQSAATVSDDSRIYAWIWQIARNAVIDHYRRSKPTVTLDSMNLDIEAARSSDIQELVLTWLAPTIRELPEPYREAMLLSEIEGLNHAEVAARLSLGLSATKSRGAYRLLPFSVRRRGKDRGVQSTQGRLPEDGLLKSRGEGCVVRRVRASMGPEASFRLFQKEST